MSIKAKQVAGVMTLVVLVVAGMTAVQMASLTRVRIEETASRATQLKDAILNRADKVVRAGPPDPYKALQEDGGLRSILEAAVTNQPETNTMLYAAIVDPKGIAVAHSTPTLEGSPIPALGDLKTFKDASAIDQVRAVLQENQFELREQILAGESDFGAIRIGVSTLLVRREIMKALASFGYTAIAALAISTMVAMLLAQWMLRPIHVIQSGLSRLGRGELDVTLDLPGQEFADLGSSFEAVSAQLAAVRTKALPAASTSTEFESVMENLEDAVALFSSEGELMFSNSAMRALLPDLSQKEGAAKPALSQIAPDHPLRQLVERSLAGRKGAGPVSISLGASDGEQDAPEFLVLCHAIDDARGKFLGAMVVARNLAYLSHVHTTLNYSRKLAALGRLMAGVAHEVKNPLNAMTIHLELLKQKLSAMREPITVPAGPSGGSRTLDLTKHVNVIGDEIKRLDQVVVGFLKFARPDELKLQPVHLSSLVSEVTSMTAPEADRRGIAIKVECPPSVPEINADPGMLQQALLNLTINACHAMPDGGTLRVICRPASRRRVEIMIEDTGVGIPPENLGRIFDLYFTTKEKGSGIGLSMVFRIVQLHDGEVEVQSTPGHGTKFRLLFPQA
ncbi:MAG TPA: ATP-binding protein [Vicinamibacterales bacterium]|nr:ATP-binding protein [Vicinamibacterales bacterium]